MMRFMAKVAIQRLIGAMPGGQALYERGRRRRIFDDLDAEVAVKRAVAERYANLLRTVGGVEVGALSSHLEMGSGWLPVLPLTFHRYGVTRQVLTDVAPLMRAEDAVAVAAALDRTATADAPQLAPQPGEAADRWLERLGVRYHAPQALPTPFPDASFDLVTITQVLQYPDPDGVRAIHQEAARLLRPGGWYILSVELADLYHHFDPALPRFNFLRYSKTTQQH
jgi:SAM-dependent methyltransferase